MRTFQRGCFVCTVLLTGWLTFSTAARGGEERFPRPSPDAIAKAEARVRDVYRSDLANAKRPPDRAALAEEFLKAADGVGQDDASRFVLFTIARDLAVEAGDGPLAMKAVAAIVKRFQPDGPTDSKEQVERGNALWKEAETAPAEKRLRLKVQAAERYLRAKPAATGLDAVLIEKRLAEMPAEPQPPGTVGAERVVVAVWENHWRPVNRGWQSEILQLFSDGSTSSPGRSTWEKKGSTITIHFRNGSATIWNLFKDGRSFTGHNTLRPIPSWGKLLSEKPMP